MKSLIATLLIALLFTSCGKLKKESYPEYEGNYDWVWSKKGTDMYDISESPDRYGFRIKKNGKVLFFKNGKLTDKGQIIDVQENYLTESVSIKVGGKQHWLSTQKDEFCMSEFPFEGAYNYFRK